MKKIIEITSLLFMGAIMVLGFQNCGHSTFSQQDMIENTPLSSVDIGDSEYKEGLSFNLMSKTASNTVSEFKVKKTDEISYSAQNGLEIIKCTLDDSNPMKDLIEITDLAKVTHPALSANNEICDTADDKLRHFKIGESSPVYLIAHSKYENCLMDNPQRLLDEGKRVFIIENIDFEEIEALVNESRTLSKTKFCTINTIEIDS